MEEPFTNLDEMPESLKKILDPMGKDRPPPRPLTEEERELTRPPEYLGGSFDVDAVLGYLNGCPECKIPFEILESGTKICPNCDRAEERAV